MNKIKSVFEAAAEYVIIDNYVRLKDTFKTVSWRLSRIPENEKRRILVMGDKGFGKNQMFILYFKYCVNLGSTKITLTLPDRVVNAQSCYNHLILAVWDGNDSNQELKKISYIMDELKKLETEIFIGGDLSFLASVYGLQNASSFPCVWCTFRANKSRKNKSPNEKFDQHDYELRTLKQYNQLLKLNSKKKDDKLGIFESYVWPIEPIQANLFFKNTENIYSINLVCSASSSY